MRNASLRMKAASLATVFIFAASISFAQTPAQPEQAPSQFPIAALGGCADREACHAYCNDPANMQACIDYAKSNGMMSQAQADSAQAFASILAKGQGPGGCSSPDACDAYCSTVANMSSCIDFAKAHNFVTPDIKIGEKMLAYIKSGGHMPGGCGSKSECMAYCDQTDHEAECQAVFEAAGVANMMGPQGNDAGLPGGSGPSPEMLQRFATLEQQGKTPSECTTLRSCLEYCNDPSHGKECSVFGSAIMGPGSDQAKFEQVHKNFQGPGGCDSKESCDTYCSDPSHAAECKSVFQNMGNWQTGSSTGQGGPGQGGFSQGGPNQQPGQPQGPGNEQQLPTPGNCNSQASCSAYCSDPAHAAECQADFEKLGNWQTGTAQGSMGSGTPQGTPQSEPAPAQ
ncbi:hypothetical protein KGP36_08095 [Patescibacteria group bacterium]|nr:hypothetical protein [Patescibacteria group bacterium]